MTRLRRLLPVLALAAALLPLSGTPARAAGGTLAYTGELATPELTAWRSSAPPELFAAANVGDVDGDGRPDVVAGYQNGHIYAWHTDGRRFLDLTTPGAGSVRSTPVLTDLNRDGRLDILGSNAAGYVYAFDGAGHRLFSRLTPVYHSLNAVFAAPVAADVTGDGVPEIIAVGWDHNVFVWDLAGRNKPGFPLFMADTMWASPAVADLNGDGVKDIVVAYDCAGGSGSRCYGRGPGGFVTALTGTGRVLPGWPQFVAGQTVWSSPAVADLNGDGRLDVVVGTGLFTPNPAGSQVNAWDSTGHRLSGWPARTRNRVFASPAVGDVNGDGRPEVSAMDDKNFLYLWDGTGHLLPGWPVCGTNNSQCNSVAHASTVLADVTGDGIADVVAAGQTTVRALDRAGHVLTSVVAPRGVAGSSAAPTVASLDGRAEVLFNTVHRQANGTVNGAVVRYGTGVPLGPAPWPMFRQNPRGNGHVDDLVAPSGTAVSAAAQSATRVVVTMTASDVGLGVAAFDAWYRDNGGALVHWLPGTAPTSRDGITATHRRALATVAGHSYRLQARARDRDGNWGPWGAVTYVAPAA